MLDTDATALDFGAGETYARPDIFEIWAELRAKAPVLWTESETLGLPFWVVTRHSDVLAVVEDGARFTSEQGMVLAAAARGDPAGGKMLVATDGDRHSELRALLAPGLSRGAIAKVEERVRRRIHSLLDAARGEAVEFMDEIAAPIPVCAICALLGVPEADEPRLFELTRIAFASEDPAIAAGSDPVEARTAAHLEIFLYFSDLLREKRARPRDDLVTALASSALEEEEILFNCDNILLGGNETTRYALGGAMVALVDRPEAWARVRSAGTLGSEAVTEILRWTSPGQHVLRTALRDAELGGARIARGDRVTCWIPSANRDERAFEVPDVLDLGRRVGRVLTFGGGRHYCWGAAFARMEIAAFFEELLRLGIEPRVAGEPVPVRSTIMHGFRSLPLRL